MTYYLGQKLVCIDDSRHLGGCTGHVPIKDQIYTIRAFSTNPRTKELHVLLNEIINIPQSTCEGLYEPYFWINRFRPVIDRSTDISIFTSLLSPKQKEPA